MLASSLTNSLKAFSGLGVNDKVFFIGGIVLLVIGCVLLYLKIFSKDLEHYHNRGELPKTKKEFAQVISGCVLWYTGSSIRDTHTHEMEGKFRKIIMINPECDDTRLIDYRDKIAKRNIQEIKDIVEPLSLEAYEKGVQVRWLNKIPRNLMVINNPDAHNTWVRLERFDLTKKADEWESIRIYRKKHKWIYEFLMDMYEILWQESKEPNWEDIKRHYEPPTKIE